MIGTYIGIGRSGQSWAAYWATQSEVLFFGEVSKISAGKLYNQKQGASDWLTVAGAAGSYTFQCPNTAPYIAADTDYVWFWGVQKTITEAQLIGYDFARTIVKYDDNAPYAIRWIMILKAGETLSVIKRNKLFQSFELHFLWDNNANFTYGRFKGNRIGYNPLPITDADGNIYTTVIIGGQKIIIQDLKTTKYNDGSTIPSGLSNANWALEDGSAGRDGAFAFPNNSSANKAAYGLLYNWYCVINAKGIAPLGCRVMTQVDFDTLKTTLGGTLVGMADKLKESGTTYWNAVNGGTNSSGFGARGGGYRGSDGVIAGFKTAGIWNLSDSFSATNFKRFYCLNNDANAGNDNENKRYGNSVRCIKI